MRTIIITAALLAIIYSYTAAFQISLDTPALSRTIEASLREKRQVETFDDEYPTAVSQNEEEPGFWDRIVKVALKLFSKFIEWLNS